MNETQNTQTAIPQEAYVQPSAPVTQLRTNRSLAKFILLSFVTFGIYGIVVLSGVSNDINTIAGRYDNKRTMHYCLLIFIIAPITLGIGAIVWFAKISSRIGNELQRRNLSYSFGATDFWLWNVLGSLIVVGPFIYTHKLLKAMNTLSEDFNNRG